MASVKRRVLIGRIFHESHSFNPRRTTVADFALQRRVEMLSASRASGSTLGGLVRRLDALGYALEPALSAVAPPGGLVEHSAYCCFRDDFLDVARHANFEAVALELHGAMATPELADVEGELLSALRAVVGKAVPIVVGLDLHAHITPAMLDAVDFCAACKENPHADVVQCGELVGYSLDAILTAKFEPVSALTKIPMVLCGRADTAAGPLAELHRRARAAIARERALWDVSLFNVFPFADDVGMGQGVLVTADRDPALAARISEELGLIFWEWRDQFHDDLPSVDQALEMVARRPESRPFVIADMGDRVLAGAPGDSSVIIERAIAREDGLKGAVPVTDPTSAAAAIAAGPGATLTLRIGGGVTPGFRPLTLTGRVMSVSDGCFRMTGPYQAGEQASLGPTAVFSVGPLSLLLTSRPGFTQDENAFISQGIDLAAQDFVVVKSGYHFKLSFAGIATPLLVDTPGLSGYKRGLFSWRRGRFFPEHSVRYTISPARIFPAGAAAMR